LYGYSKSGKKLDTDALLTNKAGGKAFAQTFCAGV